MLSYRPTPSRHSNAQKTCDIIWIFASNLKGRKKGSVGTNKSYVIEHNKEYK